MVAEDKGPLTTSSWITLAVELSTEAVSFESNSHLKIITDQMIFMQLSLSDFHCRSLQGGRQASKERAARRCPILCVILGL